MDETRPELQAPPGACDCHMHVYDSEDVYPLAPTAEFLPPPARVADYRRLQARLGLERVVIVQPSSYGADNRCTLDALGSLGSDVARAVVVVPADTPDAEFERLTKAGARGLRFHMLRAGVLSWDMLAPMAARIADFGWHVQLQFDGGELPDRFALLERLPGTLVIDHVAKFKKPVPPDHEAFRSLLKLLERGRLWVKLSAPYYTSDAGPPRYEDVSPLARALVEAAPERLVWASNWPHPGRLGSDRPNDADLLDLLLDWAPDEATRRRILVDNPAELYGF